MSAPAPANRRSASGSRRFNPLRALQPKRRLQQILGSSPVPAPKQASGSGTDATAPVGAPVPAAPAFDYCRFIELDYVPMETGGMVSMRPTKGYPSTKSPTKGYSATKSPSRSTVPASTPRFRRAPAAPSNRDPFGNTTHSISSSSGSCKGSDCSPTKGRPQKHTSCTDNHGIRPPPPEQYLTPLQQKEVCIRHLRAKLKETIHTLQDRDSEIDELRGRLCRMQEDWFEEECNRVEAQLALKEARQEIQQLKLAVDTVRDRLSDAGGLSGDIGVQRYFHDINTQNHKLENLLLNMELAQAGLAKEAEGIPGFRTRVGGSAPASVSGESPGGIPKPVDGCGGSCSCDASPARSLTRSSTYTKLSEKVTDRNGNGSDFRSLSAAGTQDSGFGCCGDVSIPSRADLLLEAAFLSEETASLLNSYTQTFAHSLPNSLSHTYSHTLPKSFPHNMSTSVPHSTYEKLCTSDRLAPFRCGLGGGGCMSHPCLSHHHLYLHPLREAGIQTESCPIPATTGYPSDLDTIAEQRTFHSKACSPTSTWLSDEGDELDSITTTTSLTTATVMSTATEPIPVSKTPLVSPMPRSATVACSLVSPRSDGVTVKEVDESVVGVETKISVMEEGQHSQGGSDGGLVETQIAPVDQEHLEEAITETQTQLQTLNFTDGPEECVASLTDIIQVEESLDSIQVNELSPDQPHTSQPTRSTSSDEIAGVIVVAVQDIEDEDIDDEEQREASGSIEEFSEGSGPVERSYWSRHFLVDLLAVAIPVVPTVAWLCRGPAGQGQPMYHIGSLLRGCCSVALHSLRRGGGLRHYPAGGGDGGSII